MTDAEQWRDCPGYTGRYQVSDAGRFKNAKTGRLLYTTTKNVGYTVVRLYAGSRKTFKDRGVARLVCEAFSGPPPSKRHVAAHRNGIKTDDRAINLYWRAPGGKAGAENANARLTAADVLAMRRMSRAGATYTALAKQFGVSPSCAFQAVIGRTWKNLPDPLPAHAGAIAQ